MQYLACIKAHNTRQSNEFNYIYTPLPALQPGDKRLIFPQCIRQLGLGHSRCFTSSDEGSNQRFMLICSKRFDQNEHPT